MRVVTDENGRRYTVTDTPSRSFDYHYGSGRRRNTVATVHTSSATADPSSLNETEDNVPVARGSFSSEVRRKSGSMSKVVRSVKNVTKGYSSVQVKVRNGEAASSILSMVFELIAI